MVGHEVREVGDTGYQGQIDFLGVIELFEIGNNVGAKAIAENKRISIDAAR
ncbi:MAG: hypothetical protein AAFY83_04675 [Pseudomonadota bacterium]